LPAWPAKLGPSAVSPIAPRSKPEQLLFTKKGSLLASQAAGPYVAANPHSAKDTQGPVLGPAAPGAAPQQFTCQILTATEAWEGVEDPAALHLLLSSFRALRHLLPQLKVQGCSAESQEPIQAESTVTAPNNALLLYCEQEAGPEQVCTF